MKRLLALICAALSALGLAACEELDPYRALRPGSSTAEEVRARLGPPQREWPDAQEGTTTWEYSHQPEGAECYMLTFAADGVLIAVDQVLNEARFARIQPGMDEEAVSRLLGRPARNEFFALKQERVWSWRIERGSTIVEPTFFTVSFDTAGRVVATGRYTQPRP
ncbi:outer membrane protein assembly factor BamE domain-containing protein [Pseudothauera lacus]|uniref:Outer membrane protein assembly factor BamE domain-containing protein n=1 Tax=Pseudothauera lacus TaxID=2136175 RepID=A0A2T4IIH9_9RHOO|nr:outer membrane protein assembly factor BamE [Pseudothauera lacus]PTD97571.1 hypothetical protein C8261_02510 [Pseudothauera lacus]